MDFIENAKKKVNEMVSVGIPTYNRPVELRRALEIITKQTYSNLEIIISDNASTDSQVKKVVDEFMSLDPRVCYFRQEKNLGVLANADFVLSKSHGEYFTWFSDDDWRSPEFIELLVEKLKVDENVDFAFCDYYEVYSDGRRADGYPQSHLNIFRPFQSKSRFVRVISYYLQNGRDGKPNLFYSLFRRRIISKLNLKQLSGNYAHLNMDCLIAFSLLQQGPVAILSEVMCTLTCGNKKYYISENTLVKPKNKLHFSNWLKFILESKMDRDLYIQNTDRLTEKLFIYLLYLPKLFALTALIAKKKLIPTKKNPKKNYTGKVTERQQKIRLPSVTLVAMATRNVEETLQALIYSCKDIEFGCVKLLSHYTPYGLTSSIEFVRIKRIKNIDDWSKKIIYDLNQYIDTDFALLVHADGFVVNSSSWRDEFLEYDYIGAPWPLPSDNYSYRDIHGNIVRVGNSVSLRSKRLIELPIKLNIPWKPYCGYYNEDGFICVKNKHIYEENGMKLATIEIAKYFSHEAMIPEIKNIKPFVFHKWAGSNSDYPRF